MEDKKSEIKNWKWFLAQSKSLDVRIAFLFYVLASSLGLFLSFYFEWHANSFLVLVVLLILWFFYATGTLEEFKNELVVIKSQVKDGDFRETRRLLLIVACIIIGLLVLIATN